MRASFCLCLLLLAMAFAALVWHADATHPTQRTPLQIPADPSLRLEPTIRVKLTPTPRSRVMLAVDGAYAVYRAAPRRQWLAGRDRLAASPLVLTENGFRIGRDVFGDSELEIVARQPPSIWVDDHQYRGSIRLIRQAGGKFVVVNVLPLEQYLAGVVDSEMPAAFPDAARRAQAIVARTYAVFRAQAAGSDAAFDVYASTRSQKYLGFQYRDPHGRRLAGESEDSRRIVRETAGMLGTFRGKPFCTYYSAVCGGSTVRGTEVFADAAAPLQSVDCRWCEPARLYRWTTQLPKSQAGRCLDRHFAERNRPFGMLHSIRSVSSGSGQSIPQFEVSDGRHRYRISAIDLRRRFPNGTLYSHRFDVDDSAGQLVFRGRGHGHGVGMCQWGARGLALEGKSCLEIIAHYYPGAEVVLADQSPPSGHARQRLPSR